MMCLFIHLKLLKENVADFFDSIFPKHHQMGQLTKSRAVYFTYVKSLITVYKGVQALSNKHTPIFYQRKTKELGLVRDLNPGPLAP